MRSITWDGEWPVTQVFGVNPAKYAVYNLAAHNGLDVGVPIGTQLYAVRDATVVEVSYDANGYGRYVKIRDADGGHWLYAHLSFPGATVAGDEIIAGTPIAQSGATGNVTGPHLHLGYRPWPPLRGWPYDGYVDPLPFLLRIGAER